MQTRTFIFPSPLFHEVFACLHGKIPVAIGDQWRGFICDLEVAKGATFKVGLALDQTIRPQHFFLSVPLDDPGEAPELPRPLIVNATK